ncbi:MAG: 6-carboxytetrahydropterin synthase [Bacteroidetes bacterium]|nr:6-carboxytetrahydropterin synthase [Bacteroidota bacterium]
MVYVTRRVHFNAAHRMHNPSWDDARNAEVFGKCNNPNWHGHNYELEVTLVGEPHPETGYVADLSRLAQLLETELLEKVDHKNLNLDVDFMQGVIPSAENFAIQIWHQLAPLVAPARLYAVRLYETPRNFVEYRGASN